MKKRVPSSLLGHWKTHKKHTKERKEKERRREERKEEEEGGKTNAVTKNKKQKTITTKGFKERRGQWKEIK